MFTLKRAISFLLIFVLLFALLPQAVFADGDPNLDGGGGNMGGGTSSNYWNPGMDGVRVTVVNADTQQPVTTPFDMTNKSPTVDFHFGKKSKINYRNGAALSPTTSAYSYQHPVTPMPTIITSNSLPASIEAIRTYFCSEYVVKGIAQTVGMNYDVLINGNYKILIEPVAYFVFNGTNVAMTAHEAAMYDNVLSGGLRSKMLSLSHKNLPLALFLEYDDLGFPAYTGASNANQSNDTIISRLGVGIVRFNDDLPLPVIETDYDYEYRVDTDVITPVTLYAGGEINPDAPATVRFTINGSTYTVNNIVIPAGESQLVWVKWHTPSTPQNITISVSTTKGGLSQTTIRAKIVDLSGNDPPDPKATDLKGSWTPASIPSRAQSSYAAWSVWYAVWHPYWVWIPVWVWHSSYPSGGYYCDHGYWEDQGWWDFFRNNYSASFSSAMSLSPDDKVPTASGLTMKSGYGVKTTITATTSTSAPSSHFTYAQTAVSYFPEFRYGTYWRLLDRTASGSTARFEFKKNIYSTYNQRAHFSPVWFLDGQYTINTWVIDLWTPAGMLSANLSGSVTISGSLYDDWHIGKSN